MFSTAVAILSIARVTVPLSSEESASTSCTALLSSSHSGVAADSVVHASDCRSASCPEPAPELAMMLLYITVQIDLPYWCGQESSALC